MYINGYHTKDITEKLAKIMQVLLVFSTGEISEQFKVLNFIQIH